MEANSILSKFLLSDKVAVITGGCGYLGRSIAVAMSEAGATTIVCDLSIKKYYEAFNENEQGKVHFFQMDVSSTKSIKSGYDKILSEYDKIDILVNNAIYCRGKAPEELSDEEWNYGVDGSLNSVYRCIREVLPSMKENGKGNIINIASMYGIISPDFKIYEDDPTNLNPPHYGAAKAGVIQLTKYFAVYLAKYNIRVNCISPGSFPHPETQKQKAFIEKLIAKVPLERIGYASEMAGPVLFLASEASSYVNGHNLVVDGGMTIW